MIQGAIPSEPLSPRRARTLREFEILRVFAELYGNDSSQSVSKARKEVLQWAENKVFGRFPEEAWAYKSFDHLSSGRSCSVVCVEEDQEIWCLRSEDPDKNIAGRTWTTEITVRSASGSLPPTFNLRLTVGTPESALDIEPHVPGVVRQLISSPGLLAGNYKLTDKPLRIDSKRDVELLITALTDPNRKLPIIVTSVPSGSAAEFQPLFDAKTLAEACAGLAITVILPAQFTWELTERFGKQLSVYEGAARVYLPGFTEDANPFGGHELVLPNKEDASMGASLARLRWIAAKGSVRRLSLGKDILAFAALKAKAIRQRQINLENNNATDEEQLEAARERAELLERELEESENYQQQFSDLHAAAEERAEAAETQLGAARFRIQQLLDQLDAANVKPDADVPMPQNWEEFANWCDVNLAGRVILTPRSRREVKSPQFQDVSMAARSLLWLANEYRAAKIEGGDSSLRDRVIESGLMNTHCGSDVFEIEWQGANRKVDWHIKNGGNTRDPSRCLRIYYFWHNPSQQVVVASMPAHLVTDAS